MESLWYKNAIIYAIDVKSFRDSNGDGMGDFPGLTSKIDYLAHLGVNCIWLLPFFPSPLRDNGYDVKDFYNVDPRLGTLEDFLFFVRSAGERGITVVIDFVMNHTSDEHPWFQASRRDRSSKFRDYYVWADNPPEASNDDHPAFPGTEHGLWQFDELSGAYYYHKFYRFQPDLYVAHPQVRDEIHRVLDFWLSMGISGFRMDAVPIMIHKKGLERTRPLNPHEILLDIRRFVNRRKSMAILIGEVDVTAYELADYFAGGSGLHLVNNFLLNGYMMSAIAQASFEPLLRGWLALPVIPTDGSWVNFLRNLDELNLIHLEPDELKKLCRLLSPEETQPIYNRGLRRRLAPLLGGNQKRIEMAFSLLFSLPGAPMFTYGDEIGMGDHLGLWEREAARIPMQWNSGLNGGFSEAPPERLYRPMVIEDRYHYSRVNVESQLQDESSLLSKIRLMIHCRKRNPQIGLGHLAWLVTDQPSVAAHTCHWNNDVFLAIHNLGEESVVVNLDLKTIFDKRLEPILGQGTIERLSGGVYRMRMEGYEYSWFRIVPGEGKPRS